MNDWRRIRMELYKDAYLYWLKDHIRAAESRAAEAVAAFDVAFPEPKKLTPKKRPLKKRVPRAPLKT